MNQLSSEDYGSGDLLAYVMSRVKDWRQYRDDNYKEKWREYYRLWRGIWDAQDKLRDSERSRLISPAIQQAVEATVSELEEASFGRDTWFDISDDVADEDKADIPKLRAYLKEDLEKEKWKSSISECFLNGAIYGTAVGEILVEEKTDLTPAEQPIPGTHLMARGSSSKKYICVKLRSVSPFNFCIDPGVTDVDEALGCAVDDLVPSYLVTRGMKDGTYKDVDIGDWSDTGQTTMSGETRQIPTTGTKKLTKYYGQVPLSYIQAFNRKDGDKTETQTTDEDAEETLVEAVVVVCNDAEIIKAVESPYMMQDRPIVAYQHDRVPDRFWGRGVVEKGYNAQKALDTELRARADALALNTHPMMGIDATRLPRGMKPKVQPGMTILTNGDPKSILMPLTFGNLNPVSYKESAELERMITMATGAMDSAAPTQVNPRNNTAAGMSMMTGASIKRQKRTLANFQDSFLIPAIEKAAYRYMQFDPQRYPVKDYKFVPSSTMGIMAREYEQQQYIQLLSMMPPESPAFMLIVQSILANSSFQNREEIEQAVAQAMQQKGPPPPDPAVLAQAHAAEQANQLAAAKLQLEDQNKKRELDIRAAELQLEERKVAVMERDQQLNAMTSQAETALKEMDIVLKHKQATEKTQVDAINNAQDNYNNAEQERASKDKEHAQSLDEIRAMLKEIAKPEKEPKPVSKTFSVKSSLTGATYSGEITPK